MGRGITCMTKAQGLKMRKFGIGLILVLAGCTGDEGVRAFGAADMAWNLKSIDGTAFDARATLEFPEAGQATGMGPCNRWSASQSAPYPWFKLGPIRSTRRACPDMDAEQRFFMALEDMTISEVSGNVLVLSNDAGREMIFQGKAIE